MARAVVPDNFKMSDMPQFNRGDGKIDFPPWRMQVKRMLSASNISVDRQSAFILGALTGESLGEILAYFGPNGPPDDIAPADLWPILSSIFASVELTPDRDNRFARVKLVNFGSVKEFQEQFNRELARCSEAPSENFKRTALMNSIAEIPQIKFEMEKAMKANPEIEFFALMQALKTCEVLMPKKQQAAAAAISTDEDLVEKIAQRLLAIRGETGRGGGRGGFSKGKSDDRACYYCSKVGHLKKDCFSFKKSQIKNTKYAVSPVSLLLNQEEDWLAGEIKAGKIKGRVLVDTGAGINIITKSYADKIGAKLAVGSEIRITFADGRETTSNLQADVEFKVGEVSSSAKFRVLTKLLPGVDVILGKPWLKSAGPAIDFEMGSVYVNNKHALGPKAIILPSTIPSIPLPSPQTSSAAAVKSAEQQEVGAPTVATSPEQQEVGVPVIKEPALTKVTVGVIGAKAMHKLLKTNNEATSLLFVSESPDQEAATIGKEGVPEVNPAMKALVDQFRGSVLADELKKGVPKSKIKHKIELKEGAQIPGQRPFRLSAAETTEISKQVAELMDIGLVRPSGSDFGAPILLVRKKDGSFRM